MNIALTWLFIGVSLMNQNSIKNSERPINRRELSRECLQAKTLSHIGECVIFVEGKDTFGSAPLMDCIVRFIIFLKNKFPCCQMLHPSEQSLTILMSPQMQAGIRAVRAPFA